MDQNYTEDVNRGRRQCRDAEGVIDRGLPCLNCTETQEKFIKPGTKYHGGRPATSSATNSKSSNRRKNVKK